jgi:hypothetical protein
MPETITIAGEAFNVNPPYTEGHALTANEARQFNQTWREAIRNNLAKKITEQKDAGAFDKDQAQGLVDQYAGEFEFGARSGSGRGPADPVESEALDMAREIIRAAVKNAGRKFKSKKNPDGVTAEQVTEAAHKMLAGPKGETLRAQAKERVEARTAAAGEAAAELGLAA